VVPSLKAVGINPDGIEIVLISHAHPDHIGGLFDAEGNLAFPNARPVAQREWNHWMAAGPLTVEAVALRHHLELLIDEARRVFHAPSTKSPLCRVA
jgi:metal-dependent hydrolase (beta-lactamase superfamily II)